MSKKWKIILISGAVVLLLIILAVSLGNRRKGVEVNAEPAALRSLTEKVSASGKIQPETEIKVQSEVSGQIIDLPVREGDVVEKGQLLVRINPDIYTSSLNRADAALNSARSNLSSAKARLAQAEAQFKLTDLNYQRNKKLFEQGAIAQAELDAQTGTWETAQAEVIAARESIHAAEFSIESALASRLEASDNLKRTTILAPMSGTVTALTKEIGETVLGNNMMAGDIIMKISAMNFMEVDVEVNESDIVRVSLGDTANVEVDAYEDEKFKGVVTEISNTALNSLTGAMSMDQVTNFSVKIRILHSSYKNLTENQPESYSPFRPGMSATVDILTDHVDDALSIPIKAVTSREDTTSASIVDRLKKKKEEGESSVKKKKEEPVVCVFVVNEKTNKAEIRVVKTGIQDDEFIHVLSGLSEGEKVITGPYDEVSKKLKPGKEVTVTTKDKDVAEEEEE
ncbi:MAG: efflux RND transporter periplasmic adaptor subunit [Nitrospirota bacterium]|nr:efflux RND transporter periplasmic adaptor subunit [Nitrospirota bacterium]